MDITCGTLSSFVDKFWDLVLDPTCEQFHHLFHYHRNIKQLNERLVELVDERSSIQHQIDEATNNAEQIEDKVLHWLRKVDEISEQIQKFHEEESQTKTECSVTSCPNPWLRYKLSKRAKAMSHEVVEICRKGNFNTVSYRVLPPSMPELVNRESDEGIGSRVQLVNRIMEELRNPSVNMIGLCGPGGVGKTTIAKEVAKSQKMFSKVIMATISDELNVEKIQGQIAEKLGMQLNEKTEEVRACRLCERLKLEKNMLLILDDLWEELDLGSVGIPFVDVENYSKKDGGCKILLTSRNETLLSHRMKCQKLIKIGVLLKNEALELFKRIAELSADSSNLELISIASEIVQKCGRLPLAIATAAKALRGKNLDEWKDYLARWKNHLRRNNTGIKEVDSSLKLSYDPLSLENKTIFLLSAMLSHDPSIDDLLMYSLGLDILEGIENIEEAHVGICAIVSKLKSLNLFLDSFSGRRVTIHDVFRDVALSIASNELNVFIVRHRSLKEWPDKNKLEGYKGICLQDSDISELPEELHGPRLEFFLLDSTKRDLIISNMLFKSSREMKVLAFTNVHFSSLPSLSFLQKLKTLCLHSCLLEDIAEVRSLKNLKVLSLAYSEIQRLPAELAQLTSLQMLNLAHCSELKVIPPKLLSSLKKLEVLYMGNSFNRWKVEGSSEAIENASLEELKDLPISSLDVHIPNVSMLPENLFLDMHLKRYRILIGQHWEWQGNYESSKILKIELESSIHLNTGVRKLMRGAEDLYLYGSNGLENVLRGHDGRAFPHLRHLQIESNDTIRYIVLNSAHHEAAKNNVSNKMSKLLLNQVLFPKLEGLELSNSISLIPLIWDDQLSHTSFSNLKTLIVKNCGFVKLVPLHVLKSLNNLEALEVRDCHVLEMVFDFEDSNEYKEKTSSSLKVVPLKKLTLDGLPKLKNVWSNHYQGNVSFPSLTNVSAYDCESLTSMFPASIVKGMLRNLERLHISHCGIDVIVATDQVSESVASTLEFPTLTSLDLSFLQNLKNFYPQKHTLEWPQLRRLSIRYCDEIEIFEKKVSSSLEIHEEKRTLDSKYPLLSHDKDIRNLEELRLKGKGAEMIGSGQFPAYPFPKVKLLHLSVKKATTISYKSLLKSFPKLEELELDGDIKEAVGGDEVPFPIKLTLWNLYKMPSLVSLPNLTHLTVIFSSGPTTLMTSSTARILVHLTHLSIGDCDQIEGIISKQEGEDDEDKEIFFNKLQYLQLCDLPRLKRFCGHDYTFRFPLLDTLIIERCPKLEIFSPGLIDTPSLQSIQLSHDGGKRHEIWDTNLNKTIHQQRLVPKRKMVLDEDDVSMIRNDQFPAHHFSHVEILSIEGFVGEGVTFPYTLLGRFPKLSELRVEDSSFEEIFPSHNAHVIVDQILPIRELSLANLTVLKVSECNRLVYLMTNSTAKSLVNLEILKISYCHEMEEIMMKHDGEDDEDKEIIFSKLKLLELDYLPTLKRFSGHSYTFRFPLLECVTIARCPRLTMFCPGAIYAPRLQSIRVCRHKFDHHKDIWMTDLNNTIQHRFMTQEVTCITQDMVLNAENIMVISDVFPIVRSLCIESFQDEGVLFPYRSLEKFPQLDHLEVKQSSFEEIFPSKDQIIDFMGKIPPFKGLSISNLDKLKSIWKDDSQLPPIHQNLTYLMVKNCCNLVKLTPFCASFENLRNLSISECHQLIHLVTSSIAKSLVSLEWLDISDCKKMEEIVMNDTNEDVEGGIIFNRLHRIKLVDMVSLKMFTSQSHTFEFPKLEEIKITGCPQMKKFGPGVLKTPKLSKVKIEGHDMEWEDEGDVNKTIQMLCSAKDSVN